MTDHLNKFYHLNLFVTVYYCLSLVSALKIAISKINLHCKHFLENGKFQPLYQNYHILMKHIVMFLIVHEPYLILFSHTAYLN